MHKGNKLYIYYILYVYILVCIFMYTMFRFSLLIRYFISATAYVLSLQWHTITFASPWMALAPEAPLMHKCVELQRFTLQTILSPPSPPMASQTPFQEHNCISSEINPSAVAAVVAFVMAVAATVAFAVAAVVTVVAAVSVAAHG